MRMVKACAVLCVVGNVACAPRAEGGLAQALADAVAKHDEPAFVAMTKGTLSVGNVWFDAPDCVKRFSGRSWIRNDQLPALFRCLTTLGLRMPLAVDSDDPALIYEPGVKLHLYIQDAKLLALYTGWIGDPSAVPVTPEALAQHTVSGAQPVEPDDATRQAVARAPDQPAFAEQTICVDTTGAVERTAIRSRSAGYESYVHAVEERGRVRKMKPFMWHGVPVRVCGFQLFAYPDDGRTKASAARKPHPPRRVTRDQESATAHALFDAITARDADAFARLLPTSARLSAIWFPDPACAKQFAGWFAPTDATRAALLACLAGLEVHLEYVVWMVGGLPESFALTYDPGVALRLSLADGEVKSISSYWEETAEPNSAPVRDVALEAHLPAGATAIEPDPAIRDAIANLPGHSAAVELMICVDQTGHADKVRVTYDWGGVEGYTRAVVAAASAWTFTPFTVGGEPVRVCGTDLLSYPPERKPHASAPPPPPPKAPPAKP